MDDLVEWLGEQLDEGERIARDRLCVNCGTPIAPLSSPVGTFAYTHAGSWEGIRCPGSLTGAEPIQDPAQVLREIAAKRQLLDEHQDVNDGSCGTCVDGHWGYPVQGGSSPQRYPCRTLRLLALPYAHRPSYLESWRP